MYLAKLAMGRGIPGDAPVHQNAQNRRDKLNINA